MFINLATIYEAAPHVKANVVIMAIDPLDGAVFEVVGLMPYPVYTYGLEGGYVDGYQVQDTQGFNHYLAANQVAFVDFKGQAQ